MFRTAAWRSGRGTSGTVSSRRSGGNIGYTYVATAHTQNDQAETVLLRLLRGSGVHGLCGIEPVRKDGIIRPLLNADGPKHPCVAFGAQNCFL